MAHHSTQFPVRSDDILVVAPTDALRASLRFLLEEENYRVTTAASIEEATAQAGGFACAVIDHHALRARAPAEVEAYIESHWPVVLLANGTPNVQLPRSFRVVTKPLLGPALSYAVREAVTLGATAHSSK
jgi:CheY-like chemotaxis protein